jgi:hypothetical protein
VLEMIFRREVSHMAATRVNAARGNSSAPTMRSLWPHAPR